jgi:hypothetical protein
MALDSATTDGTGSKIFGDAADDFHPVLAHVGPPRRDDWSSRIPQRYENHT